MAWYWCPLITWPLLAGLGYVALRRACRRDMNRMGFYGQDAEWSKDERHFYLYLALVFGPLLIVTALLLRPSMLLEDRIDRWRASKSKGK